MFRVFTHKRITFVIGFVLLLFSVPSVLAQNTNFCKLAENIGYGDHVKGTIDNDNPFVFFCFEGKAGDKVTIHLDTVNGDLIPALGLGDQFLNDIFDEDYARSRRDTAEIVYELPEDNRYVILVTRKDLEKGSTEGDFELSLEAATACSSGQMIEYDDTVRGEITGDNLLASYCFEGHRGDTVSITVETVQDDLKPVLALWDPVKETTIEENLNEAGRDSVDIKFKLEADMVYMILVSRVDFDNGDTTGRFRLQLEADANIATKQSNNIFASISHGNKGSDTCNDYPLSILSQYQWGIPGSNPDEPLLAYNVGCRGELVSTIVGRSLVLSYDIDSLGNMSFKIGDTVYQTKSVDDKEWVIDTSEGDPLILERLADDGCDTGVLADLIRGAWHFADNETFYLDFSCNGLVLVTLDGETSAGHYEYRNGDIKVDVNDEVLEFLNVKFDNSQMVLESNGDVFTFINILDE